MLWIILSVICAAYYAAVRYVAQAQQLTGIWLVLAVLFLLLFFYGWYRKTHPEKTKSHLRFRTFCITTGVLVVLMVGVVAWRILADMWSSPENSLPHILLLNQSDIAAETEEEWEARLDEAVRYLKTNESTRVIISGGWDSARGASEAHVMYGYLLEHDIAGNRILWEIRSETTKENLDLARAMAGGDRQSVGIVSSDYSMYRTLRIARNRGYVHAEPIPTPTTPWLYPHRIVQEILQVLYDKFFGI